MQILMVYQGAYAKIDSDAYAVINEDTISEVLNAYRNSYLWMDDELDIVKEMYYRVCGFTDVTMPCFENAFTRIEEFEAKEKKYRQKLLDTEACFDANELVLLQNLTESSLTYLTGLMPQGYNAATWAHGFVAGANNTASLQFTDNPELYNSILSVVVYTTENTNVINDLSEISRANCERYIIDKRWEEGWKKLSTGAFAMMSGAGALGVALGKAGVLLKVLGFVTGPTAAIFGGAEAAEGLQDIYKSADDLDKDAKNIIKKCLGEDAYYKILYGSTIASDFVCLAGLVSELNAVPGSLDNLPSGRPGKAPEIGGESGSKTIHNDILDSPRTGSALKVDDVKPIYEINEKTGKPQIIKEFPATAQAHGFNDLVDNYAGYATKTTLNDATLYQLEGSLNGVEGRFEWIIQDGKVTHRMFIQNGAMNGVPIKP